MTRLLAAIIIVVAAVPAFAQENSLTPVDFAQLQRRSTPNDYLVCPAGYCEFTKVDRAAPLFDMPAAELRKRLAALLENLPRTQIVVAGDAHIVVEQRTAVFRFPDYIDIETIAIGEDTSTIAIYSRSKYGFYDFGVNKRRAERWLRQLAP